MKHLICLLFLSLFIPPASTRAQGTVCNNQGNIVLFSNYDGGVLNINVDVNIPNLKIGVVSYEADSINLFGPYVNNVTAVYWAGYNGQNQHCPLPAITTTTINGAPPGAQTQISVYPPSPLANPNGYYLIICAYTCSTNVQLGGCNTIDQVEAYFLQQFPGDSIYSHYSQYGCWSVTRNISDGGSCCTTVNPLTVQAISTPPTCSGLCDGSASASVFQGTAPFTYTWSTGNTSSAVSDLCPGTYSLTVSDANGISASSTFAVSQPNPSETVTDVTICEGDSYTLPDGNVVSDAGAYSTTYSGSNGCDSVSTINLSLTNSLVTTVNDSMCKGAIYVFPDGTLGYGTMVHTSSFISASGCDSSIITNLVDIPIVAAINSNGNQLNALQDDALYQWVNCDSAYSIISGATNQSYTPVVTGNYAAIITVPGCKDTSGCAFFLVELISGIKRTLSENVTVYPNPASQFIMVGTQSTAPDYITVRDVIGQEVIMRVQSNQTYQMIDLSGLAQGIYILEISIHHRKEFIRLVKSAD